MNDLDAKDWRMDLNIYIQLIFLCAVNISFTFIGTILNSLVVISFWKSSQLRRKLCYLMIMVLSCVDVFAIVTNHPRMALFSIVILTESYDLLPTIILYGRLSSVFFAFSLITLFIMSLERYLSAAFPIFHRKSVTRNRLLTLLAILFASDATLLGISLSGRTFSYEVKVIIFFGILSPLFLLVNIKLFNIARRMRKNHMISPKVTMIVKLKNISSCLMAVACLLLILIPSGVYIIFSLGEELPPAKLVLSQTWAGTILSMNSTLNCLIFFWKNKILRTEGMKVLKSLKYIRCIFQRMLEKT